MEKLKEITGTWRGTYSFDFIENMAKLDDVPFTLKLKQGWFGRFAGTVTDDSAPGMPGVGTIAGRFSFPRIEFTKQMPVCYVTTPEGRNLTLREMLIEYGQTCETEVPHTPIFYQGEFSDPSQAKGTWIIKGGPLSLLDGRVMKMEESSGTWNMELGTADPSQFA